MPFPAILKPTFPTRDGQSQFERILECPVLTLLSSFFLFPFLFLNNNVFISWGLSRAFSGRGICYSFRRDTREVYLKIAGNGMRYIHGTEIS